MPTILDTDAIATCSVTYGKESSFAGQLASVSIKVVPKALGVVYLRLNWAATGDIFTAFIDSTSAGQGAPGVIVLPQTGQSGFRHGTTAFKDWYYEAVVTADLGDGQELSRTYRFSIPAGQTTLDLDTFDEDGIVTAMPTMAPFVSEPAGLSDATRTSLAATYVHFDGTHLTQAGNVIPISGGGSGTTGVALDTDGVYYPSSTGSAAIVADTDGVYYPAA